MENFAEIIEDIFAAMDHEGGLVDLLHYDSDYMSRLPRKYRKRAQGLANQLLEAEESLRQLLDEAADEYGAERY